jgi:hypothetical protein
VPHSLRCLAATLFSVLIGCGHAPPRTVPKQGQRQSATYTLVCPSPLGDLTTTLTYSVTASLDPAPSGGQVTFTIDAPVSQVMSPVSATFVSSTTSFDVPDGFQVQSATTSPVTTSDFSSSQAQIDGGTVSLVLQGSFPIDGTPRETPALVVTGMVTAPTGSKIVWNTPVVIDGEANAGFFGNQDSNCHVQTPGPIGTTQVE